ncbi:SprT family zinc-dependent metalloprotease [Porphyromonas pogonae]|uniref:M48 family metallopeptidase n=1 Tax=Porphyromonas pogonae TaxID=867595 RepID=UPI002E7778BF|nr:SprT family zinc-dependent metalloprotease [Porphyromonas pogonae]
MKHNDIILVGHPAISLNIIYSKRRSMGIYIYANGCAEVRIPHYTSINEIQEFVQSRSNWIEKHRAKIEAYQKQSSNDEVDYTEGTPLRLLGKSYRLQIYESPVISVKIIDDKIVLHCPKDTNRKNIISAWYTMIGKKFLPSLFRPVINQFQNKYKVIPQELKYRKMKSKWGSCSSTGTITLNTELIKAPESCIRYVMIHELCHLLEHNHSKHFYHYLEAEVPDWKSLKQELNTILL